MKSNFTLTNSISADDHLQKQQPQQQEDKNIEKTIKELNKEIQMLQEENNNLKQENNTFLKMLELMPEQNIQRKDFENETNWKIVKQKFPETCSKSNQTKNNEINNTPLSNRFQNLVKPEIDFSIDRNLTERINDFKYTQQSNHRINIQSVNSKNNKRPNICVTEKYLKNNKEIIRNKKVVPGNRSYAETASYGKKILVIGDSHVNRINRRKLNYSFKRAQCVVKPFSGAKIEDLEHYMIPNLKQQQPDIAVIHVGSNNVSYKSLDTDARLLAENIVEIGKKCVEYGVEHVVISSIFVKESIRLSSLIRRINDVLCELCSTNNFHFISNDIIFRKHLCGDGVHLREMGTDIFVGNIVHYINRNILGINQD